MYSAVDIKIGVFISSSNEQLPGRSAFEILGLLLLQIP